MDLLGVVPNDQFPFDLIELGEENELHCLVVLVDHWLHIFGVPLHYNNSRDWILIWIDNRFL